MKGKVLARGKGLDEMMEISYQKHLSEENSILVVHNPNSLDSAWTIYEKVDS